MLAPKCGFVLRYAGRAAADAMLYKTQAIGSSAVKLISELVSPVVIIIIHYSARGHFKGGHYCIALSRKKCSMLLSTWKVYGETTGVGPRQMILL